MPMVQIVGAPQRAPALGGQTAVAHARLHRMGIPAQVVQKLSANGAAVAISLISKGVPAQSALRAAGYHASQHRTGQDMTEIAHTPAGPIEVPMAGNGPREFPMGFGLTPVAAGANVIINANPQVNFRPSRLVVPDSIAPSFMINDFKIGMRSQFVAPGSVPAQSFTQQAIQTSMRLDTVNIGQFVTLDVTNVSTQTVNFAASLFGITLNS